MAGFNIIFCLNGWGGLILTLQDIVFYYIHKQEDTAEIVKALCPENTVEVGLKVSAQESESQNPFIHG